MIGTWKVNGCTSRFPTDPTSQHYLAACSIVDRSVLVRATQRVYSRSAGCLMKTWMHVDSREESSSEMAILPSERRIDCWERTGDGVEEDEDTRCRRKVYEHATLFVRMQAVNDSAIDSSI